MGRSDRRGPASGAPAVRGDPRRAVCWACAARLKGRRASQQRNPCGVASYRSRPTGVLNPREPEPSPGHKGPTVLSRPKRRSAQRVTPRRAHSRAGPRRDTANGPESGSRRDATPRRQRTKTRRRCPRTRRETRPGRCCARTVVRFDAKVLLGPRNLPLNPFSGHFWRHNPSLGGPKVRLKGSFCTVLRHGGVSPRNPSRAALRQAPRWTPPPHPGPV